MTEKVKVEVFVTCEVQIYVGLYDSKTPFLDLLKQAKKEGIKKLSNKSGYFNDDYKLIDTEPEMKVVITKESD